ncbi:MAG: GTP cyclohydrolase I FolE [Bacteroidaceae bacterium]|nr:GTP cyclohydrolase I FolE [Bacteroidaceae bacterium]
MKEIDVEKIKELVPQFLEALGDDPNREGLKETPKRVAKMCKEIFEGMCYTNEEIAHKFDKCFQDVSTGDLVVESDIPIHSFCEHHLMLMYDMSVAIGYIPNGKVIGLSKLARIADMVGKRLQLQERIGSDIADVLEMVLDTKDIIVVIEGKHGCMTARGIKAREAVTKTATLRGKFGSDSDLRSEFYSLIK